MATISHKNLSGTQLHELKGVASATDNFVPVAISGATNWQKLTAASLTGTGNSFGAQLFHARDEKTSGTASQTLSANTWNTRNLTATTTNEISGASLSSNQIILPAGTYFVEALALAGNTVSSPPHRLRIRNVTDSSTLVLGISSGSAAVNGGASITLDKAATIRGRFTISGTKTVELQHYAVNNSCNGGQTLNMGQNEIFAEILLWKVA